MTWSYIYIYIYIYCHLQTDWFVVSQVFSVARHVGRLKLGSEPAKLYVRLSIKPLGQQAYHVGLGNCKVLCSNSSSSSSVRMFTFLTGYQNAQFGRRALHYTSGSRTFLRQRAQPPRGSVRIYIYIYIYIYIKFINWLNRNNLWEIFSINIFK